MARAELSIAEARRIAVAAQGLGRARSAGRAGTASLRSAIRRIGLVQIDYVNVLMPAHHLVPYSRVGPYDRRRFHELLYHEQEFTEHWAHAASILPVDAWPLLRHRMEGRRFRPYGFEELFARHPEFVARVVDEVRERGPLAADELSVPPGADTRVKGAWYGTLARCVLESHFARGTLAVANRRADYARVYDIAERVVPAAHHARRTDVLDAKRELVRRAARAHGIATVRDLADYYRMSVKDTLHAARALVSAGELRETRVEGWREPAYLHAQATRPRSITAAALLSPFDPLVWTRARGARLFNFDYRIEIYVPPEKRRWGYYVLPFLLDENVVARVDLKADRAGRKLLVQAAHVEPRAKPGGVAPRLASELRTLAAWLELDGIRVARRGNLARALGAELRV